MRQASPTCTCLAKACTAPIFRLPLCNILLKARKPPLRLFDWLVEHSMSTCRLVAQQRPQGCGEGFSSLRASSEPISVRGREHGLDLSMSVLVCLTFRSIRLTSPDQRSLCIHPGMFRAACSPTFGTDPDVMKGIQNDIQHGYEASSDSTVRVITVDLVLGDLS